jgi:hypothetical protein
MLGAVRTVTATRYVTPLREGGSLPALVRADDGGDWVVKLRGAGQGVRALAAELVAGEIGRALGLAVPELALVELPPALARSEPDPEIHDLLAASAGVNLGLRFLPGAVMYDPAADPPPDAALASAIVAFDAFVGNVDRTARNPNLLRWHDRLWLIDHGAALVFLHGWDGSTRKAASPFAPIVEHVLLPFATALPAAGTALEARLGEGDALVAGIVAELPHDWLEPAALRPALVRFLTERRAAASIFLEEAERARSRRV